MEQPKVERMLRLLQLLSSKESYSVDDLMKELGISRRTVYRYIDTFRNAGFAVKNTHGNVWQLVSMKNKHGDLSRVVYFTEEESGMLNDVIDSLDISDALRKTLKRKLVALCDFAGAGEKGNDI